MEGQVQFSQKALHQILAREVSSARVLALNRTLLSTFLDYSLAKGKEDFITDAENLENQMGRL